ncbi:MAG: hypothetical protein QOD75_1994 [Blastocatellia bacterium]|jgi:hypothetical protein|nr:hypothetical protein [Blastocatellia bacterium]
MTGWAQQLWRTSPKLTAICAVCGIGLVLIGWTIQRQPRAWAAGKVPIAFWAWRNDPPSQADVSDAMQVAHARSLFLRAGQIDYHKGTLQRIRGLSGRLPQGIELHLVYNATRPLLAQLESADEELLAATIAGAFAADVERARTDGSSVAGLQVDIDVPTRLLPHYARTLRALRAHLDRNIQLSITGLPTWMDSDDLNSVLDQVDFWIPQCYGAKIPERRNQSIPISSPQMLAHAVTRARKLNRPFYAGLAAYSYVLLYSKGGELITVRGDMDPARLAADANLDLIERRAFSGTTEWRYVYRARNDSVIDDLAMQAGDYLVIDSPSTGSLRVSARTVRELAGGKLLGICVFRLPTRDDPSTLTLEQVAAALADQQSRIAIEVVIRRARPAGIKDQSPGRNWIVELKNTGTGNALTGSLQVDLTLTPGSIAELRHQTPASGETLCNTPDSEGQSRSEPCSPQRANVIRIRPHMLAPGQILRVALTLNIDLPPHVPIAIEMQTDEGRYYSNRSDVIAEGIEER